MPFKLQLATTLLLSATPSFAAYNLARQYSGQSFFNAWEYYGKYDNLTNGDVVWVNQTVANSDQLTYINSAGNAVIKVDDKNTVIYNEKRNSVRLTSLDKYNVGTVLVFDALHVPYGCSVWGALWTQGINWPLGGEIDIFEAVNLAPANTMALHTETGCSQPADGITQTGTTQVRNCDNNGSGGAGCTVLDTNANSYGAPFAAAGGGVWVTEFASTGINIWFFSRANVPASLSTNTIDVSTFGTPSAAYPASSCDPAKYFSEQQIVIDITLCGDFAGVKSVLEATCPALNGTNTCYTTYVLDPKNYANAYFELASVKIFASDPSAVVTASGVTQTISAGGSSHPNAASRMNEGVAFGALAFTAMLALVLQF